MQRLESRVERCDAGVRLKRCGSPYATIPTNLRLFCGCGGSGSFCEQVRSPDQGPDPPNKGSPKSPASGYTVGETAPVNVGRERGGGAGASDEPAYCLKVEAALQLQAIPGVTHSVLANISHTVNYGFILRL